MITIITPVYNTPVQYLLQTAESILHQTLQNFTWLIVDDGSTNEETIQLLQQLKKDNGRVHLVNHAENKGLPAARNTGIQHAQGEFIFFLDGDDLIAPSCLEKAYLFLRLNHAFDFVNSYVTGFGAQDYKWTGGFHEKDVFLQDNRNTSCFMARREVFTHLQFDETMRDGCEDWDFWLHAASIGRWGYTIPEYLFYYRRSSNKWASMEGKRSLNEIRQQLNSRYKQLKKKGFPDLKISGYGFGVKIPSLTENKYALPEGEKKLLCIFPWLQIGGADLFNLNLLKGLRTKGWKISIVTTKQCSHALQEQFSAITEDIFHLPNLGAEHSFQTQLEYLIITRQPSVVFLSNSMFGYFMLPVLKQKFPGLPIIDYAHCEDEGWNNGGYPFFSALYTAFLDKTFVTSENLKSWCIAKGHDASKVKVCYINIDTELIKREPEKGKAIRERLQIAETTPLIFYVARLTEQKQPLVLVKTLALLKKKGMDFHCIIIGEGPDKEKMLRQIKIEKLSRHITFSGEQSHDTVLEYLDAGDIFFLPSLYEGIALSIYEAMTKELAIVGCNTGGQAELVTSDCGFLVNKQTAGWEAPQYAQHLEQLINNRALMHTMGQNSRKRVADFFDLKQMIELMDDAFSQLKVSKIKTPPVNDAYLISLNRMMHLEAENDQLSSQAGVRFNKLLQKLESAYPITKKIFRKLFNR